jgi:hypothetical protein
MLWFGSTAAAVLAAEAIARPAPALAADGGNVVLGQDNTESATTVIENSADNKSQAGLQGVGTGKTSGLSGISDEGRGVYGQSGTTASGLVPIRPGRSSAVHTVVQLSKATLVLATIQDDLDGVWVRSAVPDPAGQKFTVHLNKAAPTHVKVAWFLVN